MAAFSVQCPQCHTTLKLARNDSGPMKCQCPKCSCQFEVSLPAAPAAPPPKTQARPIAKTCLEASPAAEPPSVLFDDPAPAKPNTGVRPINKTRLEAGPPPAPASRPTAAQPAPVPPRFEPGAPAPAQSPKNHTLILVIAAVAVAGFFSMGCIGISIVAYLASRDKDNEKTQQVALDPKNDGAVDLIAEPPGAKEAPRPIGPALDPAPLPKQPTIPGLKKLPPVPSETPEIVPPEKSMSRLEFGERRLTKEEFAGRALIIPFGAVASRERLEQIKLVRVRGKVRFTGRTQVNDVVITWESLKRVVYDERLFGKSIFGGFDMTLLLIRNHGWSRQRTNILALEGDGLAFYQNFNYATILSNLIPLTEGGFDVKKGPDRVVRQKDCSTAIVTRAGRPPMTLYFSKDSDLLFKADFTGRFLMPGNRFDNRATFVEFFFSDYRLIDGVKHWYTQEQWRDGKSYSEIKLTQVTFLKNTDDSMFTLPGLEERVRQVNAEYKLLDKKDAMQRAVADLGPESGSDFTRLVKGLSHADANLRSTARSALHVFVELWRLNQVAPLEPADVPALTVLLKAGDDAELRYFALEAVTRLGPQAAGAAPALVPIARDSRDAKVLTAALLAMKSVGARSNDALTIYEGYLDHSEIAVKDAAALALLNLGPEKLTLNRVVALVARPNDEVRAAAEKLLRQKLAASTRKDLPDLRQGLGNPSRDVRLAYLDAIAALKEDGKDAAGDVAPLAGSPDQEIARHAVVALDNMGKLVDVARENANPAVLKTVLGALLSKNIRTDDALAVYEKHLNHPNADVKDAASLALLKLGPDRLRIDKLTEMMAGPNVEVRSSADKLLRKKLSVVTVKDLPTLRKGLDNPTVAVRVAFIDAIGSLKADGKDAVPDLAGLVTSPDKNVSIRASIALALIGKAAAKAAPELAKAVEHPDFLVAITATHALCKLDPAHDALKTRGVDLLLDALTPDGSDLKSSIAGLPTSKSAAALIEIGTPAVMPLVKKMLSRNDPKKLVENRKVEPTAARYVAYELLKGLAERAKATKNAALIGELKRHELNLKGYWEPLEANMARGAKSNFTLPAEARQLYVTTAESAYQAYRAVAALRKP